MYRFSIRVFGIARFPLSDWMIKQEKLISSQFSLALHNWQWLADYDTRGSRKVDNTGAVGRRLSKIMNTNIIYNARTSLPARIYLDCTRKNELTTPAPRPMMFYKVFWTIHHSVDVITRLSRSNDVAGRAVFPRHLQKPQHPLTKVMYVVRSARWCNYLLKFCINILVDILYAQTMAHENPVFFY